MEKMKRKYAIIAVLVLSILLVACTKTENKETSKAEEPSKTTKSAGASLNEMSLEEIIANLSEGLEMPMTENMKVEKDWYPSYLFVDYIDGSQALANESLMSSVAHSAVILRLPEGSDVEKIRAEIEKNADPIKWVCVGAEKYA